MPAGGGTLEAAEGVQPPSLQNAEGAAGQTAAQPAAGAAAEAGQPGRCQLRATIEVLARHATQDVRIKITLPRAAKFKHVKQAIAKCLGSDDIITKGMLTNKMGGVYKAYKDSSPVGDVKEVTVACADFLIGGGNELEVVLGDGEIAKETETTAENISALGQEMKTATARVPAMPSSTASRTTRGATKPWITKRQAINLQRELYEGFKADEFQQKLNQLRRRHGTTPNSVEFQQERQELFLSVQSVVLPKYGFEGTAKGVYRMMGSMGPFVEDPEFLQLATDINRLLGVNSRPETWGSLSKSCRKLESEGGPREGDGARAQSGRPPSLVGLVSPAAQRPAPPEARRGGPEQRAQQSGASDALAFDRWPLGKYRPFKLFIAGTWNDYSPAEMHWQNGLFVSPVTVGSNGWESFQILKEGSWSATIYPSVADAGPFEAHTVCGPDSKGHGKNWQIGRYMEEQAAPGTQFAIVVTVDKEGCVRLVHWEHLA